ncbi:MAG: sigma-70 family RNA polymerase sigma factor [Nitrososphaera sp.]|nr:sigma-70 family RNA polymerase sigma factor [Nitrososphaera sp.]MCI0692306.1 sigma-70 family RNA polymerase sigma factor [candidate division KSB1 bacterium]
MIAPTITPSPNFLSGTPQEILELQPSPSDAYSIKLVDCSDEDLCRNAQRGCLASRDLLWRRYRNFIQKVLHKQNQHHHLPSHEIADVVQELYFAFHTAVERYNPACPRRQAASFKTFLGLIVEHLFSNYCAQWRRYRRRVVLCCDNETSGDFHSARNGRPCLLTSEEKNAGPSANETSLWWDNFSDRLAEVLCRLKPKEKQLLEAWLNYGRDKEVAQALGISPAAAKLRRERLIRRIRKNVTAK